MSESMVERVAKALSVADGNHPDACSNDEEEHPMWTLYLKDARAVIEAMREPNVDMLDSACAAWVKLYPAFEGEKPQPNAGEVATTIFNAMIDAALTPAKVDEAG